MARVGFTLLPFSAMNAQNTMADPSISIDGWVSLMHGSCEIIYNVRDEQDCIQWPAFEGNHRQDQLWCHTCMELFVRSAETSNYWECNFAPTGAWNVYRFSNYRENMQQEYRISRLPVQAGAESSKCYSLSVNFPIIDLFPNSNKICCGISAVVEQNNGNLQYFALIHPDQKPDFHHVQSFAVELAF